MERTALARHAAAAAIALSLGLAGQATSAAEVIFEGVDNLNLSGGGAHPLADAAEAAFAAAAVLAVQDFESFATNSLPGSVSIGGINASLVSSATDGSRIASNGGGGFDTYPVSGSQFLFSLSDAGTTFFGFTFDVAVIGFGFHITDASDWAGDSRPTDNLVINLVRASGTTSVELFANVPASSLVSGNFGYFGILDADDPFLGFSIAGATINPDEDAIGIDNLAVAIAPVPVPAGAWLFGSALAGLAAARRRQIQPR